MNYILLDNYHSILDKVKEICVNNISKDDIVVDMTIGNGNDTLFLTSIANLVIGFDIQEQAINNTKELLNKNNVTNYKLFLDSHENVDKYLTSYQQKIKLFLFNLGYLPGGDKTIMTNHKSTVIALEKSLKLISDNGMILIVCYPHEEGVKEAMAIKEYLGASNTCFQEIHNTQNIKAPYLIQIKK